MGARDRSRIRNNRKRFNLRKIINIKSGIILCIGIFFSVITISMVTKIALDKKVKKSTITYSYNNSVEDSNLNTNIKDYPNVDIYTDSLISDTSLSDKITINFLGEIMMGGKVGETLKYSYASAFREIFSKVRNSDFTYANFSTNITNLDTINDPKSKYIVTKNIINALNALGIDCVSIASDHMVDFSNNIFNVTTGILEDNSILVAGRENMPVYFEKGNKKVAIISTNSVILGTTSKYTKNGISTYSQKNLIRNIKEAKEVADVVIVDVHWGREYVYEVTDQMKKIAHLAIDEGADLVIGTHALGNYPIVKYKDKPIIYSMGYLITDSEYKLAKEGFIYSITIDENSKISSIIMEPTIITDKKSVEFYSNYDEKKCNEILNLYNSWNIENSLDSKIEGNKIKINF